MVYIVGVCLESGLVCSSLVWCVSKNITYSKKNMPTCQGDIICKSSWSSKIWIKLKWKSNNFTKQEKKGKSKSKENIPQYAWLSPSESWHNFWTCFKYISIRPKLVILSIRLLFDLKVYNCIGIMIHNPSKRMSSFFSLVPLKISPLYCISKVFLTTVTSSGFL